ncbi:hypothetical protein Scep_007935 [Stephania cephalantha]|uniref:Uncharacterized protein n=1 Tax=Stephania cephalantha TaxID=152367 RepID=A0AAP0KCJ0_9MAGN
MHVVSTINLLSLLYWISRLVIFSLVATLGDHGDGGGPGECGDLAGYRCKWATVFFSFGSIFHVLLGLD